VSLEADCNIQDRVRRTMYDNVGFAVRDRVGESVRYDTRGALNGVVGDSVRDAVYDTVKNLGSMRL